MTDNEVEIRRSGPGFRANLPRDGEIVVSLWDTDDADMETLAHKENLHRMQEVDRREHVLAQEFAAQQHAEFMKIRARA